jgi:hypothetical protein
MSHDSTYQYVANTESNRNFYFVNAHAEELDDSYTVPTGVRIIMFCYSGRVLCVGKKFDRNNWHNILLDPNTSSNYCSFLSRIAEYPTIRDHFCIYKQGDIIKNMKFTDDQEFRSAIYRLPVKAYAYDRENSTIVMSSSSPSLGIDEILQDPKYKELTADTVTKHIKIDDRRLVDLLKKENDVGIFKSQVLTPTRNLSNMIRNLKLHLSGFTVLLMTCRETLDYIPHEDISSGIGVWDELELMKKQVDLVNCVRK